MKVTYDLAWSKFMLHDISGKEDRGEDLSEGPRNKADNNILSVGPLHRGGIDSELMLIRYFHLAGVRSYCNQVSLKRTLRRDLFLKTWGAGWGS